MMEDIEYTFDWMLERAIKHVKQVNTHHDTQEKPSEDTAIGIINRLTNAELLSLLSFVLFPTKEP